MIKTSKSSFGLLNIRFVLFFSFLLQFLVPSGLYGKERKSIEKFDWNGLSVTYLEDSRFPKYDIFIYFADGALSDPKKNEGLTEFMFSELLSGTNRYGQKEISDVLEYNAVKVSTRVTHEFSTMSISGLSKDIIPTMKMICHIFDDASFPKKEIENSKKKISAALKGLYSNHSELAERASRELALKNTKISTPSSGKLQSIKGIYRKDLLNHKNYFNRDVFKKLYVTGPRNILEIKKIIGKECGWDLEKSKFVRDIDAESFKYNPGLFLVPVPNANQTQVRIGRSIRLDENFDEHQLALTQAYLGGGFLSILNKEIRMKRGLTYSVGAFSGLQKNYGRSQIYSFTKTATTFELIELIKKTIENSKSKIEENDLLMIKNYLSGSYLFQFETGASFLENVVYYDHLGKGLSDLYDFPKKINEISIEQVKDTIFRLFDFKNYTVVVVGPRSLAKQLKKIGPVTIVEVKDFL